MFQTLQKSLKGMVVLKEIDTGILKCFSWVPSLGYLSKICQAPHSGVFPDLPFPGVGPIRLLLP